MKYFAYGSNMNEQRMIDRGLTPSFKTVALLENFEFLMNKKSLKLPGVGFANIEPKNSHAVEGILYTVTEDEIKMLDKFEGYPKHYDRVEVTVSTLEGNEFAIAYIAKPEWVIKEGLKTSKEYKGHIIEGSKFLTPEYQMFLTHKILLVD